MIAVSASGRNFAALGKYLVVGRDKIEVGRVAWTSARNLPTDDPELAAKIMRATASQNVRVSQPVYHLALSFDPRDIVDRAGMERVADRVLAELKLQEYQTIIVAHADRAHPHMHMLVNRVHPETGKVWDRWQDYPAVQRALREEERALGTRAVQRGVEGPHDGVHQALNRNDRRDTTLERSLDGDRREGRSSRQNIAAIRADLDLHESVSETSRQRYTAEMHVAATEARVTQIDAVVRRLERSDEAFDKDLKAVYVDPSTARAKFVARADETSPGDASRQMREAPESLGELLKTERRNLLGRIESNDIQARAVAPAAAARGLEILEAKRDLAKLIEIGNGPKTLGVEAIGAAAVRSVAVKTLDEARQHLQALRVKEHSLPTREPIEHRLARALKALSPPVFAKLTLGLSGHRLNVAHKLREMVRDAALGRDDTQ
jgi:hypothetical protein